MSRRGNDGNGGAIGMAGMTGTTVRATFVGRPSSRCTFAPRARRRVTYETCRQDARTQRGARVRTRVVCPTSLCVFAVVPGAHAGYGTDPLVASVSDAPRALRRSRCWRGSRRCRRDEPAFGACLGPTGLGARAAPRRARVRGLHPPARCGTRDISRRGASP